METQRRDISIDALRGLGIIIMVMGHVGFGNTFYLIKSSFNMATFFLISGYLFKVKSNQSFTLFTLKMLRRLLIPYVFFVFFTIIVLTLVDMCSANVELNYNDFLSGMIWPNRGIFPIAGALWFLQSLFVVEILFYIFVGIIKNDILHFLFVILCIIFSILYKATWTLPFSVDSAIGLYPFFFLGYRYKEFKQNIPKFNDYLCAAISLLLIAVGVLLIIWNGEANPRQCIYGKSYIIYIIIATIINFGLYNILGLINRNHLFSIRFLTMPGEYSMAYLGFNQMVIFLLNNSAFSLVSWDSSLYRIIRSLLLFISVYIVIYFVSNILYKSKYRVLLGK